MKIKSLLLVLYFGVIYSCSNNEKKISFAQLTNEK